MYCTKCGSQNELNSKYCTKCGSDLNQKISEGEDNKLKSINTMSILSIVFSFILPPIGLILSIIGLIRCNRYKKETNEKVSYLPLNIAGIVISSLITFIIIFIILIIMGISSLFKSSDKVLKSTWDCKMSPYSSNYVLTVKFNENDFIWGKYEMEENNQLRGSYYILDREYTNSKNEYKIRFNPTYYISSGKESNNYTKSIDMEIKFDEKSATIISENSTRYYCERR